MMKKSKFVKPYSRTGRTTFPNRARCGVYLIKENGKLVYVGFSATDLYKTMYRHFQKWNHRTQEVITYEGKLKRNSYTVRVVYCTARQAASLEKALIKKYRPRDNQMKYPELELTAYDDKSFATYSALIPTRTEDEVPF